MKWEYEVIKIFSNDPDYTKKNLNKLSEDSWRLIACDTKEDLYVFERLVPVELTPQEKKLRDYFD